MLNNKPRFSMTWPNIGKEILRLNTYPTEIQFNKVIPSDAEAPFWGVDLPITNGIVSSKIYDKRDDFNFEIVNFLFLNGNVPRSTVYGEFISQLICFARVCSYVDDFNNRNRFLLLSC